MSESEVVPPIPRCRCCGKRRPKHPEAVAMVCRWCYDECTNEGCTDRYFVEVHDV